MSQAQDTKVLAPTNGKVEVELPAGMSPESFQKLFGTWTKAVDKAKSRDKDIRDVLNILLKTHFKEYESLMAARGHKVNPR